METNVKKIAFVFNSLDIGGIEQKIVDLTNYYSRQKNIIPTILLKHRQGSLIDKIPSSIKIFAPKSPPSGLLSSLLFPFWLRRQFSKQKPDLILSFGNYCSVASTIAKNIAFIRTPVIISEDSSIIEQLESDTFPLLRKLFVKIAYPQAEKTIALTPAGKIKLIGIVPNTKNNIIILNNWLPLKFKPTNITKKDIDILFLGRFEPQKNPQEFLTISKNLIKTIPHIKIVMVGYGSLLTEIKNFIIENNLDDNISLLPATTNPEKFYQHAKIFLLTSRHEGFPLTILEASACECLPVCHYLPELKSFFSFQKNLILFKKNISATQLIKTLLSDTGLRKKICQYYQHQVFKLQTTNFQNTINFLNKYL
jgi:glycosyltransferase involved in cell wall biosynthesis